MTVREALRENPELHRLYTKIKRSPEAGWTIAENDVIRLYQLILRYKPRNILELGTGVGLSTAVMALALGKIGEGRITSLEQLGKCIAIANTLIDPELKNFVRIIEARPIIFRINQISPWLYFCGYDWHPPPGVEFDFMLVDGPSGWIEDGKLVTLDSGDVFRLLPHLAPGCKIYVDGRRSTVKKIARYLGHYVKLLERDHEVALFERTGEALRQGEDLLITDAKLTGSRGC